MHRFFKSIPFATNEADNSSNVLLTMYDSFRNLSEIASNVTSNVSEFLDTQINHSSSNSTNSDDEDPAMGAAVTVGGMTAILFGFCLSWLCRKQITRMNNSASEGAAMCTSVIAAGVGAAVGTLTYYCLKR